MYKIFFLLLLARFNNRYTAKVIKQTSVGDLNLNVIKIRSKYIIANEFGEA